MIGDGLNQTGRKKVCVIDKQVLTVSELVEAFEEIPENGEVRKTMQLSPDRYLNGEEHAVYMKDFIGAANDVISRVVFMADKHNADRDNAIRHFASIFKVMTEISTFEGWGKSEEYHCSLCGERYTADEIRESAEMGELFHGYGGKILCQDCYERYSRQSLEEQFETAVNMGEVDNG